ncbi:MAG TPA: hypothetical protein VJY62_06115 [Bacteroidia bacterium]|nr:hypothetical protein [Bacteroidia bacterium]
MKKILIFTALLFISFTGFGQSKLENWPELKTFHSVMASTFHPSEEGNLEPIKTRAGEMVEKAQALAASKIPAEFATDKIKAAVAKLVTGSQELKTIIDKKEKDEVITKNLSALHDTFHEIVGLCMHPEGEKHDHKEGEKHEHKE